DRSEHDRCHQIERHDREEKCAAEEIKPNENEGAPATLPRVLHQASKAVFGKNVQKLVGQEWADRQPREDTDQGQGKRENEDLPDRQVDQQMRLLRVAEL